MEAPSHAVYSSLEELVSQSNNHAQGQGYKLVVVRSKTNAQGHKTWVQLACDRHGEYHQQKAPILTRIKLMTTKGTKRNTHNLTEETRKKNRRSRRCECPMFCVASKTGGGLWELSVRNPEHNHGPYEATPKRKKGVSRPKSTSLNIGETSTLMRMTDLQPQHSSELVNLPLLQTPSHCIADFCLVPIGTGNPSVSAEIAEVQRLLKRSGLTFQMSSAGTCVEGPWDDVMRIIGQAHSLLHASGVARIQTDLRIGSRTDKKQTANDKVAAVQALLNNEEMERQDSLEPINDETEMTDATPTHLRHSLPANMDPAMAPLDQMVGPPGPQMQMPHSMAHHPMAPHLAHRLPPELNFNQKPM